MAAPHAVPDDGKMALTIVHKPPKIKIVKHLLHFLKGKHYKSEYIENINTDQPISVQVDGNSVITMQLDGEIMTCRFNCEILPGALNLLNTKLPSRQ